VTGASGSEAFEGGCCYKVGAVTNFTFLEVKQEKLNTKITETAYC